VTLLVYLLGVFLFFRKEVDGVIEAISGETVKASLEIMAALLAVGMITALTMQARNWLDKQRYGDPNEIVDVGSTGMGSPLNNG